MTKELEQEAAYEPAHGSSAVVCWIVIVACVVVVLLSFSAWMMHPVGGFPFLETLLSSLVIFGCVARLRGWAPPPKGKGGVGGP